MQYIAKCVPIEHTKCVKKVLALCKVQFLQSKNTSMHCSYKNACIMYILSDRLDNISCMYTFAHLLYVLMSFVMHTQALLTRECEIHNYLPFYLYVDTDKMVAK